MLDVIETQHLQFTGTGSVLSSRSFKNPNRFCLAAKRYPAILSQIASVGSQISVKMYGRKPGDNLDYLGYIKYMEYAAT